MRIHDIEKIDEKWSKKYKKSIDCHNPKGFSQKAHCAGRKKRQHGEKTKSKSINESITNINATASRIKFIIESTTIDLVDENLFKIVNDLLEEHLLDENLHKWFKEKWVRFGPDGKIRGPCARGKSSEGKPKCLPLAKAKKLSKKKRATAARRKRREDPNAERTGKARSVQTKESIVEGYEKITEYRDRMYQYLKSIVPGFPDYVVKDWLYANFARGATQGPGWSFATIGKDIPNILKDMGLSVDTKWQLVPHMKFTMDMWEPKTLKRLQARAGGNSKTTDTDVHIPARDAERHATQAALAKQQGGVRKEPVILIKTSQGYELLEGWHRTIQHFAMYPQGYTGPAYVAVAQGQQGVAEGSMMCPHCGGSAYDDELLAEEKDACYYKVKKRYKIWPSAYASGALVQCRKKGAKNWGKSK